MKFFKNLCEGIPTFLKKGGDGIACPVCGGDVEHGSTQLTVERVENDGG